MVRRHRGFTLLEVLVALAVVAITMGALIKVAGTQASNASYLRDRTLAQWVGSNVVAAYQLDPAWPEPGLREGMEEMARQRWYWRAVVTDTFDNDVRRLDVSVRAREQRDAPELTSVVAFLPRPASEQVQEQGP